MVPVTDRFHVDATGTAAAGKLVPRKPRTLLLRGSCTASSGTHIPGPGDSVSRGTPPGERVGRGRRCMNGIRCSRRSPQESGASQRRLLSPLTICSGQPHVSRETTRNGGTYGLRFHRGAHNCGQPLSDGEAQSTELCTTVDKHRSALWPAPMARDHPPVRARQGLGRGLRREEEDRSVHTACTERS